MSASAAVMRSSGQLSLSKATAPRKSARPPETMITASRSPGFQSRIVIACRPLVSRSHRCYRRAAKKSAEELEAALDAARKRQRIVTPSFVNIRLEGRRRPPQRLHDLDQASGLSDGDRGIRGPVMYLRRRQEAREVDRRPADE